MSSSQFPAKLYADMIGKPFAAGARGPSAYDCVGMVLELQRRQGRDLGDFASTPEEFHRQYDGVRGIFGPCVRVEKPVGGCIVLLRMLGDERHVGTMIDPWRMIHTSSAIGSGKIERLLGSEWTRRVIGYYLPDVTKRLHQVVPA